MDPWNHFPLDIPSDQQPIWVRVNFYYGTPFLATFDLSTLSCIDAVNGISYPVWSVARWKPV